MYARRLFGYGFLGFYALLGCASAQTNDLPAFVAEWATGSIWAFPQTGPFPYDPHQYPSNPVVTGLDDPSSITYSSDGQFVYIANRGAGSVCRFPVSGPSRYNLTTIVQGLHTPSSIAISPDGLTCFVTDTTTQTIYSFPTEGSFHPLTVAVQGLPVTNGYSIVISPDGTFGLVCSDLQNTIYRFPTKNSQSLVPVVTFRNMTQPSLVGMAFSPDGQRVLVTDYQDGWIYSFPANGPSVDLSDLKPIVNAGLPQTGPSNIQFSTDGATVFVTTDGTTVYSFSAESPFLPSIAVTNLSDTWGIAIWHPSLISTLSLSGNNLILATYLNKNAPFTVRNLFAFLNEDALNDALENAAPTRNAYSTYTSQVIEIGLSNLLNNRLGQQRLSQHRVALTEQKEFVAESDLVVFDHEGKSSGTIAHQKQNSVEFWMSALGEYIHVHPRHQTPDFHTGSGGVVVAGDYHGVYPHPIGAGMAYAYTHIHEAKDSGHANINQGYLFVYGAFPIAHWYCDATLWGGYYHSRNIRDISFSGYSGGSASSAIRGWQLAPHLEMGYDYWMDWLGLNPFVIADYVACWERSVNESGSTLLNFGQKGRYCSLVHGETGMRVREIASYSWGSVTFIEQASYVYQKAFHTGVINAFLIGSPGSFTVTTLTTAQNMGAVNIEALIQPSNQKCYGSLSLHAEAGSRYQAYEGMIQFGKQF